MKLAHVRHFASGIVALACCATASLPAQCATTWQAGLGIPGVNGTVYATTMWDRDGAGPLPPRRTRMVPAPADRASNGPRRSAGGHSARWTRGVGEAPSAMTLRRRRHVRAALQSGVSLRRDVYPPRAARRADRGQNARSPTTKLPSFDTVSCTELTTGSKHSACT